MAGPGAKAVVATVLALVAAAAAIGCGGSSDDDPAADSQARAAYIDDLNRVCAEWADHVTKTSQRFEATEVRADAADRLAVTADRYERLAAGLDRLIDRAHAITPPAGDEETVAAWLTTVGARASDQRDLARALRAQPTDNDLLADAQERLRSDTATADEAISAYGADECAPRAELIPSAG